MKIARLILCLFPCFAQAEENECRVTFAGLKSRTDEARIETIHRFIDQACVLNWEIVGVPGSKSNLDGTVFLAAGKLVAPVQELAFQHSGTCDAQGKAVMQHDLKLPDMGRPLRHLVRWSAGSQKGAVFIESSPRGLLSILGEVQVDDDSELTGVKAALERDQVTLSDTAAIRISAPGSLAEAMAALNLRPGETRILFGNLPGIPPETCLVKMAGEGRLILLPQSYLSRLPDDPSIQNLFTQLIRQP